MRGTFETTRSSMTAFFKRPSLLFNSASTVALLGCANRDCVSVWRRRMSARSVCTSLRSLAHARASTSQTPTAYVEMANPVRAGAGADSGTGGAAAAQAVV